MFRLAARMYFSSYPDITLFMREILFNAHYRIAPFIGACLYVKLRLYSMYWHMCLYVKHFIISGNKKAVTLL